MSDAKNLFNEPIKNYLIAYENIRKIANDQEDDYTTDCLLNYHYFKNDYKMIAKGAWCWSISNTANSFYCIYRLTSTHGNVL